VPPDDIDLDRLADILADRLASRLEANTTQRYLTVASAAVYSALSEDSIRGLLSGNKLTALRPVPGRILIDRRELDALLLSSTHRPRQGRGTHKRAH